MAGSTGFRTASSLQTGLALASNPRQKVYHSFIFYFFPHSVQRKKGKAFKTTTDSKEEMILSHLLD